MTETDQPDYTGERAKHLDMIQGVVSRLAGNSAVMKRYCIVMVAVGVATYKTIGDPRTVAALVIVVAVFWLLDARYLQQERWFRSHYDQVRAEPPERRPDFRMTPDKASRTGVKFCRAVFSWSTAGLYLPLIALLAFFWWTL